MAELQALKAASRAKESEEKRHAERRRNALVLIMRHLVDNGYTDTYERLSTESNLTLQKVWSHEIIEWCRGVVVPCARPPVSNLS